MDSLCRTGERAEEIMAQRYTGRRDGKSEEIEPCGGVSRRQKRRGVCPPLHRVVEVGSGGLRKPCRTVIKDGESASGSRKTAATASHSCSMRRARRNFNIEREEGPGKWIAANRIAHIAGHGGQCYSLYVG